MQSVLSRLLRLEAHECTHPTSRVSCSCASNRSNLSYPDYFDWKRMNKTLGSLDVYTRAGFSVASPAGAERVPGARVSSGFFRTLGVAPWLGRDFLESENQPSAARVVILSYSCWQNRYGGQRGIIGQSVVFDGDAYTIIGVLPTEFHFAPLGGPEFWTTIHTPNGDRKSVV